MRLGTVWAPNQQGYGEVAPTVVFNGGDPTGEVSGITWESWGAAKAVGHGQGLYVAPDQTVAEGTLQPVEIVAFELGSCEGSPSYNAVQWYFPQHGEKFEGAGYFNICTGDYVDETTSK